MEEYNFNIKGFNTYRDVYTFGDFNCYGDGMHGNMNGDGFGSNSVYADHIGRNNYHSSYPYEFRR